MEIEVERAASRGFRKMPREASALLISGLERIAVGQLDGLDVKAMRGTTGSFRLREGDRRAVYRIADDTLFVERAGHRREVYR